MIELTRTPLLLYPIDFPNRSQDELQHELERCQKFLATKETQNALDSEFFDCNRKISALYLRISDLTQKNDRQLAEESCKKALHHIKKICIHHQPDDQKVTALLDISDYRLYRVQKSWEQVMPMSLHKELRYLTKGSCEIEKALRIRETVFATTQKEKYKEQLAKMWIRLKDEFNCDFLDDDDSFETGRIKLRSIRIESDEDKQKFFNAIESLSQDYADPAAIDILISLTPESEKQRLQLNICKWMEPYPEILVAHIKTCSLPRIVNVSFRIPALEKIKEIVDQKLDLVRRKYEQAVNTDDVLNEENSLLSRLYSLKEQIERAKSNEKKLKDNWQKDLKNFLSFSNFIKIGESSFWEKLESIHQRHPACAVPFLYLLFYQQLLPLEKYTYVLKKAYACDPYQTYMLSVAMLMTFKESKNLREDPSRKTRLNVLRSLYPKDLVLSNEMENGPHLVFENLNVLEPFRSLALQQLASRQIDESIQTLIKIKQSLIGVSFPHEYLALAWALKGDISKAFKLLERSSICCLPQVPIKLLNSMSEMSFDIPETSSTSLLVSLIKSITRDFDLGLIENLINDCTTSLKENRLKELPYIYFSIQWLITHTIPLEFEVYKNMWGNLFDLLSLCADLNYRSTDGLTDPWINDHFSRTETPLSPIENPLVDRVEFQYTVSFPAISWGMVIEEEIPPFVFQNLELTKHSIQLVSANLTKKIYGFLLGIICKSHSQSLLEQDINTLPDYSTLFLAELQVGFSSKPHSHAHQCAMRLLDLYLNKKPEERPYTISEEILNWASWNKSYHKNDDSNANLSFLNLLKKFNKTKVDQDTYISLMDVLRAKKNLEERIASDSLHSCPVDNGSNLYEIFEFSQKLFGWRLNETFEKWGDRLRADEKIFHFGVFNEENPENELNAKHSSIEFSLKGEHALKMMRGLLQFWQKFHEHVSRKNEWIALDGEESDTEFHHSKPNLSSKWRPEVEATTWRKIIEENKPLDYPSNLVKTKDFESLVAKKHEHACEIKELKNEYKKLCTKIPISKNKDSDILVITAARMHMNAEYLRTEKSHSVYVSTKEDAEYVYRLILEATTERLIQKACREKEFFGWTATNGDRASPILVALELSKDHFHGPETHLTGEAPFHWHYNACIYNSSGKFINFHIYYDA